MLGTLLSLLPFSLKGTGVAIAIGSSLLAIGGYLWYDYQQTKALNIKLEENLADMHEAVEDLRKEAKRQSRLQEQTLESVQSVVKSSKNRQQELESDIETIREADREDTQNTDSPIPLPKSVSTVFEQLRREYETRSRDRGKNEDAQAAPSLNLLSESEAPTPLE